MANGCSASWRDTDLCSAFANAAQITVVSTFVPQVIIIGAVAGLASALASVLGQLLRRARRNATAFSEARRGAVNRPRDGIVGALPSE